MANDEDQPTAEEAEATPSAPQQQKRRRGLIIATGAAVAAVGALVALQIAPDRQSNLAEPDTLGGILTASASLVPMDPAVDPAVTGGALSVPGSSTSASPDTTPQDAGTKTPAAKNSKSMTVEEEIEAARDAAAKAGYPLRRPLVAKPKAQANGPVSVTNEGSLKKGASLRTVSARYDLTGQRELLWAAGKPEKVGQAECTQKFRFSNDSGPKERPTMLLCWRTSDAKSVLTVAVTREGRPSAKKTVAALEKKWKAMG
jgi:hypothetical protein